MYIKRVDGPRQVTLSDGTVMTRADLPPADTRRWVARRKALVVMAVEAGLISREAALDRYALSDEEFSIWEVAVQKYGLAGLRVTKIQEYRQF
ncbi:DUF1153 domain-containing protein [Gemmobacter aquarius]|uniref:DUF1153 domain-containing protein n=1 Tax=Paragemmobacter aquarius TaxID=2169400 RepID=A0A2S0ULL4_9RHOB|nr:DUF1153 domain-containing protein [Gemmobacter aquarius]AWB48697.1 DUF1153 domain-containing protein [Gemmobacter aquarius]